MPFSIESIGVPDVERNYMPLLEHRLACNI
jgi:hypothetical protein